MLDIAADTISNALTSGGEKPSRRATKNQRLETLRRGTFVTLHVESSLQGCIGSLEPRQVLADDISTNAYRAAFHDPRFPAMRAEQLDGLTIHISVLGELEPMRVSSETDLISQLRPGEDGLVLVSGARRATFLPSVWEKLGDASLFVSHLKHKAGIGPEDWPDDIRCFRYGVDEFEEADLCSR